MEYAEFESVRMFCTCKFTIYITRDLRCFCFNYVIQRILLMKTKLTKKKNKLNFKLLSEQKWFAANIIFKSWGSCVGIWRSHKYVCLSMVSFEFDKILDYIQFESTFYKTYFILYFRKWNSVAELCRLEQHVILDNFEPIAHRPGRKLLWKPVSRTVYM